MDAPWLDGLGWLRRMQKNEIFFVKNFCSTTIYHFHISPHVNYLFLNITFVVKTIYTVLHKIEMEITPVLEVLLYKESIYCLSC